MNITIDKYVVAAAALAIYPIKSHLKNRQKAHAEEIRRVQDDFFHKGFTDGWEAAQEHYINPVTGQVYPTRYNRK